MKDNAKCFILTASGYEEITYTALQERREADPGYLERRFIPLHGMLMEVSPDDYQEFYRDVERKKYLRKEANRVEVVSFHALDTEEMSGEDIVVDSSPLPDETVMDKLLIEQMLSCVGQLDEDDRALITALYYDRKSERDLSKEWGIPRMTLSYRKGKALKQLRRLMKI